MAERIITGPLTEVDLIELRLSNDELKLSFDYDYGRLQKYLDLSIWTRASGDQLFYVYAGCRTITPPFQVEEHAGGYDFPFHAWQQMLETVNAFITKKKVCHLEEYI